MRAIAYAAAATAVVTTAAAGQASSGVDRLAWLQGCWEAASAQRTVEEQWMAPRSGSMLGMSRTIRDGRLTQYELIVVREDGDRLAFHAHPSGQPSAVFLSRTLDVSSAVFENPAHDFPQEVGYRRTGAESLLAWIAGTRNGERRRVEFRYRRVPCAAAP